MLRNPVIYDKYVRRSALFLCISIGIVYALVFGWAARMSLICMVFDGVISATLWFVVYALLWSVYMYGIPDSLSAYRQVELILFYCLISVFGVAGMELLAIYLISPYVFGNFVFTLPSRIFCLVILYGILHVHFRNIRDCEKEMDEEDDELELSGALETGAGTMEASGNSSVAVADGVSAGVSKGTVAAVERITVRTGRKIKVIPVDDLVYIKAEDDYVSLVTAEGHWLKNGTMKEYERKLPSGKFARVHRSYIVNIAKIVKIERYGQKQLLQLVTGTSLRISNNGYKILREKLDL